MTPFEAQGILSILGFLGGLFGGVMPLTINEWKPGIYVAAAGACLAVPFILHLLCIAVLG